MADPRALLTIVIAGMILCPAARAEEAPAAAASRAPTRELRLGATLSSLVQDPFPSAGNPAPGILASYEFLISESFAIALALSYQRYDGSPALHQVAYGALLRHEFAKLGSAGARIYGSYGLLLQVSSIQGEEGSGTTHDSRLTLGADFPVAGLPLYAEASYHFSRLRFLNVDSRTLDYWELGLGWRHAW